MKKILLTRGKVALVDDGDFKWLSQWKWCAQKSRYTFYALRTTRVSETDFPQTTIMMHRLILEEHNLLQPGHEVDHRDGNGLNNQISNLRSVTRRQNQQNRVNGKKKSSKFPGVHWKKRGKKWTSQIRINGKVKYLGLFEKEEDAAMAYIVALKQIKENE